ncbi:protein BatD [Novipirellula galeiformis]|uniref:protein BatD n=1 Tax=Novipirellula galeiformis TaxID=2528004 RepID=UPI0011B448C8|nr:protein BatD [Novipirellula galeiformis]
MERKTAKLKMRRDSLTLVLRRAFVPLGVIVAIMISLARAHAADHDTNKHDADKTETAVKITESIDRTTTKVLEPIVLTLAVVAPVDSEIDFHDAPETLGAFQVVGVTDSPGLPLLGDANRGQRRWTRRLVLETLQVGEQEIPSIEVTYTAGDSAASKPRVLRTQPMTIQVESVLTGDDQPHAFRPMKDKMVVPPPQKSSRSIAGILTIAVLGLGLLAIVIRLQFRKRATASAVALQRLSALDARRNSSEFDPKWSYVELAGIARDFVISRDGMNPLVMTTDEVIRYITTECSISADLQTPLVELLLQADQFKFAPHRSDGAEMAEKVKHAERLVRELIDRLPTASSKPSLDGKHVSSNKEGN